MKEIECLYERYKPLVYRYLYSVCGDGLLAEDVTQETFFRIIYRCCSASGFQQERFFRKSESVERQIFSLAMQLLEREMGRKRREEPVDNVLDLVSGVPTMEYLPETSAIYNVELDEVYEKMKSLKEPVRNVMFLRYYRKRTYKEIAACLEQSENWVKHIISKGKEQLGQMLCHDVSL